ncbi:MAG: hypothetical protein KF764_01870 [Labilithrix sp.]|nr:hypothetical protein [Labilithrix sp.]
MLPVRPTYDARPLFLAVLYELGTGRSTPQQIERPLDGKLDPETFSFSSTDGDWQWLQGHAEDWRPSLPDGLRRFFADDTPAFAVRVKQRDIELELFLRPAKDPVTYGTDGSAALRGRGVTINYVQRPRLELIGTVRAGRGASPILVHGDATQDRHWMTATKLGVRWMWLMARFDDGRECMAYEIRTATGGRKAPADSGDALAGGAWLIEREGTVRACNNWSLVPSKHVTTSRGLVPSCFCLTLPDDGIAFTIEHEQRTFVPTRALGELIEAGIWESPARLVDARGVTGGRFWADVMGPFGSV